MQRRSTPSIAPPSSWYPIPPNQTALPPCIPSTFSFSFHTNEDKINRHSSIEVARLTLISGASVHTNCTTTGLLFGHPMFGHKTFFSCCIFFNKHTIFLFKHFFAFQILFDGCKKKPQILFLICFSLTRFTCYWCVIGFQKIYFFGQQNLFLFFLI
jgi:hypothetical protein